MDATGKGRAGSARSRTGDRNRAGLGARSERGRSLTQARRPFHAGTAQNDLSRSAPYAPLATNRTSLHAVRRTVDSAVVSLPWLFRWLLLLPALGLAFGAGRLLLPLAPARRSRTALLAGLASLAAFVGGDALAPHATRGTYYCSVCGVSERRLTLRHIALWRREFAPDDPDGWLHGDFARWWAAREPHPEHAHDWTPTGAFEVGEGWIQGCYEFAQLFHRALPLVPDPAIAGRLLDRLASAAPEERDALLDDFWRASDRTGPTALFKRLVAGTLPPDPPFAEAFEFWLAEHPRWR